MNWRDRGTHMEIVATGLLPKYLLGASTPCLAVWKPGARNAVQVSNKDSSSQSLVPSLLPSRICRAGSCVQG